MNKRKTINETAGTASAFSLTEYFGQETIEKAAELFDYIQQPVFKKNQTGITHRNLSWWTSEKVLDKHISNDRKFTFTEYVWIKMVEQMRVFNVPLPYLAILKTRLFEVVQIKGVLSRIELYKDFVSDLKISPEEKQKLLAFLKSENTGTENAQAGVSMLQLIILECILKRKAISLAFFPDCSYMVIDKSKEHLYTESDLALLNHSHYMTVCISKLLSDFLRSDLAFEIVPKIQLLTYPENKLYEVIRTGDYESILIQFKDKKIKHMELKKGIDTQKKIVDILSEGEFSEIVVKKHKGIVTKIEQNIKIAF